MNVCECLSIWGGGAVGAIAEQIDDISGRGEPGLLSKARGFLDKRFGKFKVQEGSFVHVGMQLVQKKDFSWTLTQEDFAKNLKLLPTTPSLWAGRKNPQPMDDTKLRQRTLGELCWVAAVSLPDMCAFGTDRVRDQRTLRE